MDIQPPVAGDSIPQPQFNEISRQFFNTHLSTDENVKAIRNIILKQNQQKPFVEKFVNYAGYPVWDKAIFSEEPDISPRLAEKTGSAKVIFIPFAPGKDSTVGSILKVKINGSDTTFKMMYKWQYNEHGYRENSKFDNADQAALFLWDLKVMFSDIKILR